MATAPIRLQKPRYNLFLNVPDHERATVLALGARWDRIARCCLIPCSYDLSHFGRWLTPRARLHQRAMFSEDEYIAALAAFMCS